MLVNELGEEGCKELARAIRQSPCGWSKVCLNGVFRSASLTVENHINDGGFDALIDALLPQLELLTELSLSRRCFSFLSRRKRAVDRVDRPHRRADRRGQAAPPGDSGPVL